MTGCGSLGAASVGSPLEREAADMLLWTKRGESFGLLARSYCLLGSHQERVWMRDTYNTVAAPHKVMILCAPMP